MRFKKGHIPINKGQKTGVKVKCLICDNVYYNMPSGHKKYCSLVCYFKDKIGKFKHSEATKRKIGNANRISLIGVRCSPRTEYKKGHNLGIKRTPEEVRKRLCKREMSSLEKRFQLICDKLKLPFSFVGNGKIIVENKNPDFIYEGDKKIAIEVFYTRHKDQFRGGADTWMEERKIIFERNGWEIVFLNERQVNEEEVLGIPINEFTIEGNNWEALKSQMKICLDDIEQELKERNKNE